MSAKPPRPLHVLIATPLGEGGKGGVDRMMDVLRRSFAEDPDADIRLTFMTTRGPGSILLSPAYLALTMARAAGRRLAGRADVLHINLGQDGSTYRKLALALSARLVGLPYILHLHGAGYREFWDGAPPRLAAAIRSMFERAAAVVVLGRVWSDYVQAKTARVRPVIIPNATLPPEALPDRRARVAPPRILFLGEIGPRKGTPDLIRALAKIKGRPWSATIAGNGEIASARREAAEQGLQDRIDFPGWLGPKAVVAQLLDADVLVLPSYEENQPMSVIEGMAYGLPVVATPVGAVPEILEDGVSGLLHAPGDVDRLATLLDRVVDDPDLRETLGQAARAFHLRHLAVSACRARFEAVWRRAAEQGRPRASRAVARRRRSTGSAREGRSIPER